MTDGISAEMKGDKVYWKAQERVIRYRKDTTLVTDFINLIKIRIKHNGYDSAPRDCPDGVPQGSSCSHTTFTYVVNGCAFYLRTWQQSKRQHSSQILPSYHDGHWRTLKPGAACADQE